MKLSLFAVSFLLASCASAPQTTAPPIEARIVRAGAPAPIDFAEGLALKLTPEGHQPASQLRLVERAGYRTPLHVHHETDETFVVVSGQLTLFVNGQTHTLGPGDYAFIPRGMPHAQGNQTAQEVVTVITLVPGGFEGFFDARAEIVLKTPPDHPDYGAAMRALGERFDIEVVGPAPF